MKKANSEIDFGSVCFNLAHYFGKEVFKSVARLGFKSDGLTQILNKERMAITHLINKVGVYKDPTSKLNMKHDEIISGLDINYAVTHGFYEKGENLLSGQRSS